MRAHLEQWLLSIWQGHSRWTRLLSPAAHIYAWLLQRRAKQFLQTHRGRAPRRSPQQPPLIVVGNAVLGGVGKTPVVIAMVQQLRGMGYRPGVIARGHGASAGAGQQARLVRADSDAAQVGDEPLLIVRKAQAPMAVGRHRVAALKLLLEQHPEVNVVVSDDGLQHWALPRDLEIIVWDERGLGNGQLLPAGMLREPWPRPDWHPYAERQAVLHLYRGAQQPRGIDSRQAWPLSRQLASYACNGRGEYRVWADFPSGVRAFAGIAQPEPFFQALQAQGLVLWQSEALPDHADVLSWWRSLSAEARRETWLCTEKDAVKLWSIAPEVWAVPLELTLSTDFLIAFEIALKRAQAYGTGESTRAMSLM